MSDGQIHKKLHVFPQLYLQGVTGGSLKPELIFDYIFGSWGNLWIETELSLLLSDLVITSLPIWNISEAFHNSQRPLKCNLMAIFWELWSCSIGSNENPLIVPAKCSSFDKSSMWGIKRKGGIKYPRNHKEETRWEKAVRSYGTLKRIGKQWEQSQWKGVGGIWKRLKGLRQRESRIKPEKLTWQYDFHESQSRSKVIAKAEEERKKKKLWEEKWGGWQQRS